MASSLSMEMEPDLTASIMPLSSETGMKEPDNPPTREQAIMPPFLTASLSRAKAAVVPWVPTWSKPMCSKMCATESPNSAVGASERSMMPKGTPRRSEAMVPTSCPARVILKAAFFTSSATWSKLAPSSEPKARSTTPGPETPTETTQSGSSMPWKAPAMKGLSPTELAKTTSLAHAMAESSLVSSAACLMTPPIFFAASMLMPARELAIFTEEQTTSVVASASGMELMSFCSAVVAPFSTRAE